MFSIFHSHTESTWCGAMSVNAVLYTRRSQEEDEEEEEVVVVVEKKKKKREGGGGGGGRRRRRGRDLMPMRRDSVNLLSRTHCVVSLSLKSNVI